MLRLFLCFLFLLLSGCSILKVDGVEAKTGYSTTHLEYQGRVSLIPVRLSTQFHYVEPLLPSSFGSLNPKLEVISDQIISPEQGYLVGICPMLQYKYRFDFGLEAFLEAGAGPTYLSLKTFEQGGPGFNFIDQIGGGIRYEMGPVEADVSYRFSHLSHAGLRDTQNRGIDSHTILLGLRIPF